MKTQNRLAVKNVGLTVAICVVALSGLCAHASPRDFSNTVLTQDTASGTNSVFSTKTLSDGKIEEKVVVDINARTAGGLDPRVERHYSRAIPSNTTDDYQWKGFIIVDSAHDTTVFQLLNTDTADTDDLHRPVLFLEANRFDNADDVDTIEICDGRCADGAPQVFLQTGDNNFHLRVKIIDGIKAEVYIDNVKRYTKEFDRYSDLEGNQVGTRTTVRYGAYHHDTRVSRNSSGTVIKTAESKAQIRIRDPEFRRL